MPKPYTVTLSDDTVRHYARKVEAVRFAVRSGQDYVVRSPTGQVVADRVTPTVADVVAAAAELAADQTQPARTPRTFDATGLEEYTCAGACGETKPVRNFITKNHTPRRYVECRKCRDARVRAAKEVVAAA